MGRPRRYAALGALAGAIVGAAVAVLTAHARAASGAPPPFLLETVGLFVAPPFGLLLAYPLAALTGLGGAGVLVWTVLTPAANWALSGSSWAPCVMSARATGKSAKHPDLRANVALPTS
jgi:hypothetical protein